MVVRFGDDEFVVATVEAPAAAADRMAAAVIAALSAPVETGVVPGGACSAWRARRPPARRPRAGAGVTIPAGRGSGQQTSSVDAAESSSGQGLVVADGEDGRWFAPRG